MKKVFFNISADAHKAAKAAAALSGMLLRDYIAVAIQEKVARDQEGGARKKH